jgi:septum formation protein
VRAAEIDETPRPGEPPAAYVRRLALAKASAGARAGELVLGADTVVEVDGDLLGKPRDGEEACAMLGRIAGREHTVWSGVALCEPDRGERTTAVVETTRVAMARMTAEEIRWYVGTGEPLDKAGSYAVQGLGALFVEAVFGSYTNVVGLPLPATRRLFGELGYELLAFRLTPRT